MANKRIKRALQVLILLVIMMTSLVLLMLFPQLLYANKYPGKQVLVYSSAAYSGEYDKEIDKAVALIKQCEWYDKHFQCNLFLNSAEPVGFLLRKTIGDAYAWGYYHNVVINSDAEISGEWLVLRNYQRHFARTLAHEMVHCLQANKSGWMQSRPVKNIPEWKWEGYAEYISYKNDDKKNEVLLYENIQLLLKYQQQQKTWIAIDIPEGKTYTGISYLKAWVMIMYLLDIKELKYADVLKDEVEEENVFGELMKWYRGRNEVKWKL